MLAVVAVHAGLVAVPLGVVAALRPLPLVGLSSRPRGAAAALAGLLLAYGGASLPAPDVRVPVARSRLDALMPRYQFAERHRVRIDAPPDVALDAVRRVTAGEIRFFRTLTWVRRLGRDGPVSLLNAPAHAPVLDVATRSGFRVLADEALAGDALRHTRGHELVLGSVGAVSDVARRRAARTAAAFEAPTGPGYLKLALGFRIAPDGRGGTVVTTETRVFATDAATRRRFARYWRLIYPGSALIRRGWLAAIRARCGGRRGPTAPPSRGGRARRR